MKIICNKADLLNSINISMRSVPAHTTIPILECIMIDVRDDIKFTTNDTELGIETLVPGIIEEEGSVAINAKLFYEMVRKFPDEDVTITVNNENLDINIMCGKANFHLIGQSGEEFTYLPAIEKEDCITISQFSLKEIIRQTIFSIAINENNKTMTGELFDVRNDIFKVVSLDGHRISIRKTSLRENYDPKSVIVPGKSLIEVAKILADDVDETVNMYFARNHIIFEMKDTTVVSRLIDGEYFKIDNMLSSDYDTKIKVNRRELLSCIDRSTLLVRENDKKPIIFDIKDNFMNLFIESTMGSMNEVIAIDKEGSDIMIGFNPKFLIDALKVIDDEEVNIYLVNPKAPCFIRNDNEDYIYIILPVNFVR